MVEFGTYWYLHSVRTPRPCFPKIGFKIVLSIISEPCIFLLCQKCLICKWCARAHPWGTCAAPEVQNPLKAKRKPSIYRCGFAPRVRICALFEVRRLENATRTCFSAVEYLPYLLECKNLWPFKKVHSHLWPRGGGRVVNPCCTPTLARLSL